MHIEHARGFNKHDDNEMHNLGERTMSTNTKNIVLVHDGWADGSSRSKEIAISKERRTTVDYCTTC
jgi:hypothetical protein